MQLFVFSTVSFKLIPSGGDLTVPGLEVYPAAQVSAVITRISSSTGETYSWAQPYAGIFLWPPLLCFLQLSTLIWVFDECNGKQNALVLCNQSVFVEFRAHIFLFLILDILHYFCGRLLKWKQWHFLCCNKYICTAKVESLLSWYDTCAVEQVSFIPMQLHINCGWEGNCNCRNVNMMELLSTAFGQDSLKVDH